MESKHVRDNGPWYKQRWPWLLMIGPAWVVVGAVIMITLANRTPDALVVDDYYKKGKAINQDLRRDRVAAELGMWMELRYSPASGTLSGTVRSNGQPVAVPLHVRLVHSTQPAKDQLLLVTSGSDGKFFVPLAMLERARWQVVVEGPGTVSAGQVPAFSDVQRKAGDSPVGTVPSGWRLTGEWKWPDAQSVTLKADALLY